MLIDSEANSQDSGKMQQEAFSLATNLLSKLEKHPIPKHGKHMHVDSGWLNCEWGNKKHLPVRAQRNIGIKSLIGATEADMKAK